MRNTLLMGLAVMVVTMAACLGSVWLIQARNIKQLATINTAMSDSTPVIEMDGFPFSINTHIGLHTADAKTINAVFSVDLLAEHYGFQEARVGGLDCTLALKNDISHLFGSLWKIRDIQDIVEKATELRCRDQNAVFHTIALNKLPTDDSFFIDKRDVQRLPHELGGFLLALSVPSNSGDALIFMLTNDDGVFKINGEHSAALITLYGKQQQTPLPPPDQQP